jgi:hypothetical protein
MMKNVLQFVLKYWSYLLIFMVFLIIYSKVMPFSDDLHHTDVLNRFGNNAFVALFDYYHLWGGKLVPHFLWLTLLGQSFWVFRILSSLIWVGLIYSAYLLLIDKSVLKEKRNYSIALVLAMLMFVPYPTLFFGAFWASGAFVYLYSSLAMVVALLPIKWSLFDDRTIMPWKYWPFYPFALYVGYSEQAALIVLVIAGYGIISQFIRKMKIDYKIVFYTLFIVANFLISTMAPGNAVRKMGEFVWFTNFDMLGIVDKFMIGANISLNHIFGSSWVLILIILLLVYGFWFIKKSNMSLFWLSCIMLIYTLMCRLLPVNLFSDFSVPTTLNNLSLLGCFGLSIGLSVILFASYLIFRSFEDARRGAFYGLMFLFAFLSSAALGFSPTIYASGPRIFLINDIAVSLVGVGLISNLFQGHSRKVVFWLINLAILVYGLIVASSYLFVSTLLRP